MDKKEILEAVKAMNVLEVKELVEMFKKKFGVSPGNLPFLEYPLK